jgi:hypothetical protein
VRYPPIDCGHTCPAKWIHECVKTAGHPGRHCDWTDRTWTDEEIARMDVRREARENAPREKERP